jgi:hypothetical protein
VTAAELPAEDVAAILRAVARKELPIRLLEDLTFEAAYVNSVLFSVGTPDGEWLMSIFNDCAEIDYVEGALAPDGRFGQFETWDSSAVDPLELLSEQDAARLEAVVFALKPSGHPKCGQCSGFGWLTPAGIAFFCGCSQEEERVCQKIP